MLTLLLSLLACAPDATDTAENTGDTGSADTAEIITPRFTFAVLADSHVTSHGDHEAMLQAGVDWVNARVASEDIALVLIVGDIAWGEGLDIAPAILDQLTVPWVPLIGDNEIHGGSEEAFADAFAPQYDALAGSLDGWQKLPTPIDNPETGAPSWFQCMSFEYDGVHFLISDWATRTKEGIEGETADLQDFDGGSWPWFQEDLAAWSSPLHESVVMASHHPMHFSPGAFDIDEQAQVDAVTLPRADDIEMSLGGHYHLNLDQDMPESGYSIHVTDALFDPPGGVRLVYVSDDGERFLYEHVIDEIEAPGG